MRSVVILIVCGLALIGFGRKLAGQEQARYGARQCGGLAPGWLQHSREGVRRDPVILWMTISSRGDMIWNGQHVKEQQVIGDMVRASEMQIDKQIWLIVEDEAPCDTVLKMRHFLTTNAHCGPDQRCIEFTQAQWQGEH